MSTDYPCRAPGFVPQPGAIAALLIPAILALATPPPAVAQEQSVASPAPDVTVGGIATAIEISGPIRVDGRLDEPEWRAAPVISGFRQVEPVNGAPATFDTEVRILFDQANVYIGVFAHDSAGRAGIRAPDLRRDWGYGANDLFGISLDPFGDGRTAIAFQVNALGALRDLRVSDGALVDGEWKGVWEARTEMTDSGWSAEIRIPWSTLRYPQGERPWGVNFVRTIRRLGEESAWAVWPRANNAYTMQYAGTLQGIRPPAPTRNLRVQPYVTMRSARTGSGESLAASPSLEVGGDVKWAVTSSSVVDLTINTDFAEADADREVVDLSRFSVFFPEKRPFFLENAGLFQVGGGRYGEPFFSRRVGLDATGVPIPIDGGARFTHQSTAHSAGAMLIHQGGGGDDPSSTFAVGRYQRNIGAAHRVGGLVSTRVDEGSAGLPTATNTVAAVDAFIRPSRTFFVRGMAASSWSDAGSRADGTPGNGWTAYMHLSSRTDWGYFGWIQSIISPEYHAAAGFVPRRDLILTSPAANLDLRPEWLPDGVRSFTPGFTSFIYHGASNRRLQEASVSFRPLRFDFHSGAQATFFVRPAWQVLEREFRPLPGVAIEPGRYRYTESGATWQPDISAPYWAWVTVASGRFFDGHRDRLVYRASPLPGPRIGITFDYSANRLRGVGEPGSEHVTHLAGVEVRAALNPRLQLVSFYQRNTVTASTNWNTRISWEFRPLSHVYLVFNDGQPFGDGLTGLPPLERRQQLILKGSYLR